LKCRQFTFSAPWLSSTARKCRFQIVSLAPTAPNGFMAAVPSPITGTTRDAMQTALRLLDRQDRNHSLLGHPQRLNTPNTIFSLISLSQCSSRIPQGAAANAADNSRFANPSRRRSGKAFGTGRSERSRKSREDDSDSSDRDVPRSRGGRDRDERPFGRPRGRTRRQDGSAVAIPAIDSALTQPELEQAKD
jgi:hypothetical protein